MSAFGSKADMQEFRDANYREMAGDHLINGILYA